MDKESYFVPLNVEAVQFLVAKNLAVNHFPLDAPPAVQTWTANCWNATPETAVTDLAFSGLFFMENRKQLKKGRNVSRKSITVIPENYEYLKYLKMFICLNCKPGEPPFPEIRLAIGQTTTKS